MKSTKKVLVLFALVAAVGILAGCASKDSAKDIESKAEKIAATAAVGKRYTAIDDPTSAFSGINPPAWVVQYLADGNLGVEKLPDYKNYHCFVIDYEGTTKDFAVNWVRIQANAGQQVSQKIATTVTSNATTRLEAEKVGDFNQTMKAGIESMSNTSFSGLTYNANYWAELENQQTHDKIFRAYALWLFEKKSLDNQVAAYLAQQVEKNTAALSATERAIYADMIAGLRSSVGFVNDSASNNDVTF
jgi:hypothetical protein